MKYKTVPVDEETHEKIQTLCQALDMGKRGQGALVRRLVNAEFEKWSEVKLLPKNDNNKTTTPQR